jgi:pimeloyl-ACP methyl ester carboxylesterase
VLQSTYAHPDALFRAQLEFWRWLVEVAPSERAFFEAFFTWVYTPRAHADGSLSQIIEETLAFTYQQSVDAFQAQVDALMGHDTTDRLSEIAVRTLVIAGEFDIIFPARFGRLVASSPRRLVASSPRRLVASSPKASHARSSTSCPARPTSPSRKYPKHGTNAWMLSGARLRSRPR